MKNISQIFEILLSRGYYVKSASIEKLLEA